MEEIRFKKSVFWLIVLLIFSLTLFLGKPGELLAQEKKTLLKMGALPSGSGWYFLSTQIATVVNRNLPNVEISARETTGTRENVLRMSKNELDLGMSEALVSYECYRGIGRFKDKPIANHRLLWNNATTYMHWAVTQDSGIKTFEELEGKLFNPSTIGGGGEYITEKVFELLGFTQV
jgi:TRAP transporter TAXI family solute receptor